MTTFADDAPGSRRARPFAARFASHDDGGISGYGFLNKIRKIARAASVLLRRLPEQTRARFRRAGLSAAGKNEK